MAVAAHCASALILGRDPQDHDTRVMAGNRIKYAAKPASLAFGIEAREHEVAGEVSRVRWIGDTDLEAADILHQPKQRGRPSKMDEYVECIREQLADGRRMPSDDLKEAVMSKFEISDKTYKTARQKAGVKTKKQGFMGTWEVYLA